MESGEALLSDLINEMRGQMTVGCRAALRRNENGWILENMVIDVASEPPRTNWSAYDYGKEMFISDAVGGEKVASWLLNNSGEMARCTFQVPQLNQRVRWERQSSHTLNTSIYRLKRPYSFHIIEASDRPAHATERFTPLVKTDCPSYPNYATAVYDLLYNLDYVPGTDLPRDTVFVRTAHEEAWIEHVYLAPRSIGVAVQGSAAKDTRLVIGGSRGLCIDERLQLSGSFEFALQAGLPKSLWIVLSRGDRWLDYRELDTSRGSRPRWDNVAFKPGSICEEVEEFLYCGENDKVEFKLRVPDEEEKFLKTVAAFANGGGGVLLVGVANGTGEVKGITGDIGSYKDGITNSIHNRLTHDPNVNIEHCEINGRQVIAVFVQEGKSPPYGLKGNLEKGKPPTFFVRRNATTFVATHEDIREMARKNLDTQVDLPETMVLI